jgi:hypothetical protein
VINFLKNLSFARIARITIVTALLLAVTDIILLTTREYFFPFHGTKNSPGRCDFTEYCHDYLPKEKTTRPRVIFFGDSTIQGLNRKYKDTLSHFLAIEIEKIPELKGAEIINLALGNATPADTYLVANMFRDFEADLVFLVVSHRMSMPDVRKYHEYPQFLLQEPEDVLADDDVELLKSRRGTFKHVKVRLENILNKAWFLGRMKNLYIRWWVETDMGTRLAGRLGLEPPERRPDLSWRERTETGGMTKLQWFLWMKYAEDLNPGPQNRQYRFVRKTARTLKKHWNNVIMYGGPVCLELYDFANPDGNWAANARKSAAGMLNAAREVGLTPYDYTEAIINSEYFADQDHLLAEGNRILAQIMIAEIEKMYGSGEKDHEK